MPPANYSTASNDAIQRIVFDQDGDPYPASDNPWNLKIPAQVKRGNKGFRLAQYYAEVKKTYDREGILDAAANRIKADLSTGRFRRLVFLIKGYNNSYESSHDEYEWARDFIATDGHGRDVLFAEIYWDAIYKGKGTAPAPLAYFADSMTYSNLAGTCGLMALLHRLPAGTDVTFLTHSRGAAVALGSVSDPVFDPGIKKKCLEPGGSAPKPVQLGDVRLVAFAPAIGSGHARQPDLFDLLDRMYVGWNPNDPAVTKKKFGIDVPDDFAGDTRLGGNEAYLKEIDALWASKPGAFQRAEFKRRSHDWPDYFTLHRPASCLLWAGKVIEVKPDRCDITR